MARTLGDRLREGNVLGGLGLVMLKARKPELARQYQEQALNLARTMGDRFAEKLTLERLAAVQASRGEAAAAAGLLSEALGIARVVGDRDHEAKLLWQLALRQADLGQREQALSNGQAAVQLLEVLGKPSVRQHRDLLQQYRRGGGGAAWRQAVGEATKAVATTVTTDQTIAGTPSASDFAGPGYLEMGISAAKAWGDLSVRE